MTVGYQHTHTTWMVNCVKDWHKLTLKAANIAALHGLRAQAAFVDIIPSAHPHGLCFWHFVGCWQCCCCRCWAAVFPLLQHSRDSRGQGPCGPKTNFSLLFQMFQDDDCLKCIRATLNWEINGTLAFIPGDFWLIMKNRRSRSDDGSPLPLN